MSQDILTRIASVVGPNGLLTEPTDMAPFLEEERGLYHGKALAVVRPASTKDVSDVVKLCAEAGVAIIPQGGNTGLCGGGCPTQDGPQIIISTGRMNAIRSIDPLNFTMTVEAGVVLQTIQQKADEAGCLFPLSLGAEGSCQIGGNISTNAGGSGVLRYGNTRELVLGLEVVLPDGQVWDGLRSLRKDNTGYDLKQLYIGGEGTLGVITAAVIKMFPKPRDVQTAFVALADLDSALALLARARAATGDQVTAFELVGRNGLELDIENLPGISDPFESAHDWYVLMELSTSRPEGNLQESLETLLGEAMEAGEVVDAVMANSMEQRNGLWRIREGVPEAQKKYGGSIKHDISVPVSSVPEFIRRATPAVEAAMPGVRVIPFGHVGDGNIHYNLSQPKDGDKQAFLARWEEMNRIVHDIVVSLRGSISAEHGIGVLKKIELEHYKPSLELDLMRKIKAALDPKGLMNPGKVI
ncbi:MAG TPA: FAD-binding oxidoreductase [Candidatus Sulfotelmatobacter sp.]|jgi:D-lactate dehydrogenase (cytochrome)|nr:FAD-binding oxidoreductase [Candidatus Sulfotelmatobacter sp.]